LNLGNPLIEAHIRWERVDYEMNEKTQQKYENGTSFLHISNAQRDDIGHFRCIADNRVANPVSRDALLIVKCKLAICYAIIFIYLKLQKKKSLPRDNL
jgi:Immunoglobulin I-set domain